MNRQALLCRSILEMPSITQRELAEKLDMSLGTINSLVKECTSLGFLKADQEGRHQVTEEGLRFLEPFRVDGALFIAAGFGSRFVPLTFETPKGLLEVQGERMIERQIKQLLEVGITDITIVVGYLKEKFEYLIDQYGVKLLYNPEYSGKNTLATIYHARKVLEGKNMYVLSSDNWMRRNMYHTYECGAWYSSVKMEGPTSEWCLSYNKKGLITNVSVGGENSWVMYGPVFFSREFSEVFLPVLEAYYHLPGTEEFYWEQVYLDMLNGQAKRRLEGEIGKAAEKNSHNPLPDSRLSAALAAAPAMFINRQPADQVYEFENLEELRRFDSRYQNRSNNQAMELVSSVFQVPESEIVHIRCLKSGMTNQSFLFQIQDRHYICRIPGPGTEELINRRQEKEVYDAVAPLHITEHVLYFNGETGYKISEYYEQSRTADSTSPQDMAQCMALIRRLHQSGIAVNHSFDLRERIRFYEQLCLSHGGIPFEDYSQVSQWMRHLLDRIDQMNRPKVLAHIDPNVDNILFLPGGEVKLVDWEYAGMADPLLDIAMCSIYSYYDFDQAAELLKLYLEREPDEQEKNLLVAYMALGGFLWSLWAVYKSSQGQEFGEYTIIMYRYGKTGYRKLLSQAHKEHELKL